MAGAMGRIEHVSGRVNDLDGKVASVATSMQSMQKENQEGYAKVMQLIGRLNTFRKTQKGESGSATLTPG